MGYKEEYKKMSDEELVLCYRNGDKDAAEFLVEKYKNLVRKEIRTYFLEGAEEEDLIQEGSIGLWEAIKGYKSEKNVAFMVFASICIKREIKSAVTRSQRLKNKPLNEYVSFDTPIMDEQGEESMLLDVLPYKEGETPENVVIEMEQTSQLLDAVFESLSKMEAEVLELFMEGLSYEEIGKVINKPAKAVDNAMQRIRSKINSIRKNS